MSPTTTTMPMIHLTSMSHVSLFTVVLPIVVDVSGASRPLLLKWYLRQAFDGFGRRDPTGLLDLLVTVYLAPVLEPDNRVGGGYDMTRNWTLTTEVVVG